MMYYYNNSKDTNHNYCMIIDEYNNYFINISYEDYEGVCERYSLYTNIKKEDINEKNNIIYEMFINRLLVTKMKDVPDYIKSYIVNIIKQEKEENNKNNYLQRQINNNMEIVNGVKVISV